MGCSDSQTLFSDSLNTEAAREPQNLPTKAVSSKFEVRSDAKWTLSLSLSLDPTSPFSALLCPVCTVLPPQWRLRNVTLLESVASVASISAAAWQWIN